MNKEQKKFQEAIKKKRKHEERVERRKHLDVKFEHPIEHKIEINKSKENVEEKKMGWYWWLPLIIAVLFALYLLLRI